MFVIIDKNTNKVKQTIDKNYGIKTNETELLKEITDKALIDKVKSAQDYSLVFIDGQVIDINVVKTRNEWQKEQELNPKIIEENVDTEKVVIAEAIVDLNNEIENLKHEINILKGGK